MTVAVAVLGASGSVGRAAAEQLASWGVGPLRLGARRPAVTAAGELAAVDLTDPATLKRFCTGSRVVLNCAGPALEVGDTVARAAFAAGADYVDAAGDDALYAQLAATVPAAHAAVISAGMMPGLTGLLPRALAAAAPGADLLTGHVGGRDRFTATAALDYLAAGSDYGAAGVAWRAGRRIAAATVTAPVPGFPEQVTALPYLSTETERMAAALGLHEVRWFSAFAGERVLAALRQPAPPTPDGRQEAAVRLCRAAELDLFGQVPYQTIALTLTGTAGPARTLVLTGTGAGALTAAAAALTTTEVLAGRVPPGLHHAAEVLDPVAALRTLRRCTAVTGLIVPSSGPDDGDLEEGDL